MQKSYGILTYNINGITRLTSKLQLSEILATIETINSPTLTTNIICLQETRAKHFDAKAYSLEYTCTLSHSSLDAFSGVATILPKNVFCRHFSSLDLARIVIKYYESSFMHRCESLQLEPLTPADLSAIQLLIINEGRICVCFINDEFILINIYVPARRCNRRLYERSLFLVLLFILLDIFVTTSEIPAVIVGDFNAIYIAGDSTSDHTPLAIFSHIMSHFFITDVFAKHNAHKDNFVFEKERLNSHNQATFWNATSNDRAKNIGSRIDYILLVNCEASKNQVSAQLSKQLRFNDASDHDALYCVFRLCKTDNFHALKNFINAAKNKQWLESDILASLNGTKNYIQNDLRSFFKASLLHDTSEKQECYSLTLAANSSKSLRTNLHDFKKIKHESEKKKQVLKKQPLMSAVIKCPSHNIYCIVKRVRKIGPNEGRVFASCPLDHCNYFQWVKARYQY